MAQPCAREAGRAGVQQHAIHVALVLRRGSAREGQRRQSQVEVEQAVAEAGLVVVVALGLRGGDDLDLPPVEAEALVDRANLRLGRLRVRQEDAACAAFDDRGRDARILDVRKRLRGEDDADVLLAQRLEPLADARREHRVIEEQPRFIEDQQRGRTVKAFIETRKEVMQHGHDGGLAVHQLLHLEALHVGHAQPVVIGVQQLAVRAAQHIGRERLAQHIALQQHGKPGHRALLHRRTGQAPQRRPDGGLLIGADRHAFMQQAAFDPFGRPGAVAFTVDTGKRLESDFAIRAQVVVLAAQPEDRGAHRAAHVEREDARAAIAAKLHRQRGEQDRLAHAGRAGDQRVAHVADVRHQPERRRAIGARDDQRRAAQVVVLLRPGPYRRHRHHVRQVQRRDDGLAHIGVGVARKRGQPRIHGVERFGDGDEPAPLNDALHHAQLLVRCAGVRVHDGDGRRQVAEGDLIAAQLLQVASASAALLFASVSTSGLSCWKIVSRNSAMTFLRLANHWRRKRPIPVPPRICRGTESAYSSDTQIPGG